MPFIDWVNKNQAKEATHNIPIHFLHQEASYGDISGKHSNNLLIQGDNLLALKALLPVYAGRIKCVFIDPPYNTQSAFEHYDDKLEHSQWLSMMYPRLVLLRELLSEDGSIWTTADDNEAHYLKVVFDEVFGRANFVSDIAWQKVFAKKNKAQISGSHDHLLVVAKSKSLWNRNLLPRQNNSAFKNPDSDPRGPWQSVAYSVQSEDSERRSAYRYRISLPAGGDIGAPQGRHWNGLPERTAALIDDNRLWFGPNGDKRPRIKVFLSESKEGIVPDTWWTHQEAGSNQDSKKEMIALFPDIEPFSTPKPEKLIHRVLTIASNEGDLVLDSFLGSGTTAAVAHKMGRRYIGVEVGEHARTYCVPRLQKVIDGEQGGISEAVNWKGGGGFRFCTLGQTAFDSDGRINPDVSFNTLASFIWHFETASPAHDNFDKPLLGVHNGTAYYLLYNGILGDKRPNGGNVLTRPVLQMLKEEHPHEGPKIIYGETTRLGDASLVAEGVTFQQIPYDIKVR